VNGALIEKIELLSGAGKESCIASLLQATQDGRADHAAVPRDVNA
jgi:hypothetical protein